MKVLVTGGSGFIGSNYVIKSIMEYGDEVYNIDKMTYASNPFYLRDVQGESKYHFIKDDINKIFAHENELKDVDAIINFSAESHVDNSIRSPEKFIKTNIMGTFRLLEFARIHDLRFHQISTDEVFGSLPYGTEEKFTLETKYDPKNPYSASKASADFFVRSFENTYGLKATISNCSNNYGPYQHREKLIPHTILSVIDEKKIPIYGSGKQIRDWIYVEDHCDAIHTVLLKGNIGSTYLIGSDEERTNIDVVKQILYLMKITDENAQAQRIEYVQDRPGHDKHYGIDPSSIRSLGWKPRYGFKKGLERTVKHYLWYAGKYRR